MCGIVAIYSQDGGVVSEQPLRQGCQALQHRGPDASGIWLHPQGKVGLGHQRLSIIDLAQGQQPMPNEDQRLHLVVNGELYDYEKVRQQLMERGHRLRSRSDSEIVLHLYEDHDLEFVHQLRGEYALILWDETRQRLLAVRDRFGIKPLFYSWHEGRLYLASEAKALFAAGVPARWNLQSLYHGLMSDSDPMDTLFAGVQQVPPGHMLVLQDGQFRLQQYWDFDYPAADQLCQESEEHELIQEFGSCLDEAVRLRLRADVPVGCYLSGGIDSCAVLGLAARQLSQPIRAFTLTFDHQDYDEGAIAQEMAERTGAQFHPIPICQDDLADHFSDAITQAETLCINAHGVAKYLLSRAVRQMGTKVVLTGEGSDEILAGYPHFRRDILLYNRQGQDPEMVQQLLQQLEQANPVSRGLMFAHGEIEPLEFVQQTLGFVPSWMEASSARSQQLRSLLLPDSLQVFHTGPEFQRLLTSLDVAGQLRGRDPVNQSLYLWAKTTLPRYILTMLGDRMEMAHSVEGRVPFLDHKLVELACRLPVSLKIRGLTEKFVLRESMRPVLSTTVYHRSKHPFLSPPATLRPQQKLNLLVRDLLSSTDLPLMDRGKLLQWLDSLPGADESTRVASDPNLMLLASACVLQQRYGLSA